MCAVYPVGILIHLGMWACQTEVETVVNGLETVVWLPSPSTQNWTKKSRWSSGVIRILLTCCCSFEPDSSSDGRTESSKPRELVHGQHAADRTQSTCAGQPWTSYNAWTAKKCSLCLCYLSFAAWSTHLSHVEWKSCCTKWNSKHSPIKGPEKDAASIIQEGRPYEVSHCHSSQCFQKWFAS